MRRRMGRFTASACAGLAAVVLTAFYMTRLICEVFLGQPPLRGRRMPTRARPS